MGRSFLHDTWIVLICAVLSGPWLTVADGFSLGSLPQSLQERKVDTRDQCMLSCLRQTYLPCRYVRFFPDTGLCLMTANTNGATGFEAVRSRRLTRDSHGGKKRRRSDPSPDQDKVNVAAHSTEQQTNPLVAGEGTHGSGEAIQHYAERVQHSQRLMETALRGEVAKVETLERQGQQSDSALELVMRVLISRLARDREVRQEVRQLQQALASLQSKTAKNTTKNATTEGKGKETEARLQHLQLQVAALSQRLQSLQESSKQERLTLVAMETRLEKVEISRDKMESLLLHLGKVVSNSSEELAKMEGQLPSKADSAETESRQAELAGRVRELHAEVSRLGQTLDQHSSTLVQLSSQATALKNMLDSLARSSTDDLDQLRIKMQSLLQQVNALRSSLAEDKSSSGVANVTGDISRIIQRQVHTEREIKKTERGMKRLKTSLRAVDKALREIKLKSEKILKARTPPAQSSPPREERKQTAQKPPSALSILENEKNLILQKLEQESALLDREKSKVPGRHVQHHQRGGSSKLQDLSKEIEKEKKLAKVEDIENKIFVEGSRLARINSQIARMQGDSRRAKEEQERAQDLELEAEEAKLQAKLSLKTAQAEQMILQKEELKSSPDQTKSERTNSAQTVGLEVEKRRAAKTLQNDKEALQRMLKDEKSHLGKLKPGFKTDTKEQLTKDIQKAEEIAKVKSLEAQLLEDRAQIAQLNSKIAQAEGDKTKALSSQEKADDLRSKAEEMALASQLSKQTAKIEATLLRESQNKHTYNAPGPKHKSAVEVPHVLQHNDSRNKKEREKLRKDVVAAEELAKVTKADAEALEDEAKVAELRSEMEEAQETSKGGNVT